MIYYNDEFNLPFGISSMIHYKDDYDQDIIKHVNMTANINTPFTVIMDALLPDESEFKWINIG